MKPTAKQGDLNGFLDRGSHLRGELRFDTHFRVHGKFSGEVKTEGELIVGEGGEVEGELQVGQVIVSGTVRGTIQASRRIQITSTGRVFADVETPSLIVEDGATFEGHCAMTRDAARAAAAAPGTPKLVSTKLPAARES
ncbi:MAG TPA: polymer-forming cytoskeletal protein [Thermoanaerobaculia bacterium]|nr:polymer-forming cytoskeletal protein [Thermoanaerobaculia bacterium]